MARKTLLSLFSTFFILTFFIACSKKKTEIPMWEISKPNAPTSYLAGTINYLKKEGNEAILTQKMKTAFDSSSTFITQIDVINSDFLLTKNQIEIGMDKTLKDILSDKDFAFLSDLKDKWTENKTNKFEGPENAKIKLLFYLQDIIYQNGGDNLFLEQMWLKQAMPAQKTITGLETYQKHYQDLSQVTLPEQIEFMKSIGDIGEFKNEVSSSIRKYYLNKDYEEIYKTELEKFSYNKTNYGTLWVKKHREWATALDPILSTQPCFISMDIKHLFGKENLLDNLLSKGYSIKKIQ